MPAAIDITGQSFGRLTAVNPTGRRVGGSREWMFSCACGGSLNAPVGRVRSGNTRSCGCLRREAASVRAVARNTTHGMTGTPTWRTWRSMLDRCRLPGHAWYHLYGGRGIVVCERWRSFENFLMDMGERPDGATIDRINNDGNYEPGNCRWASHSTQMRNRRDRVKIEAFGEALLAIEWAERTGVDPERIRIRILDGWPPEKAVSTPVRS